MADEFDKLKQKYSSSKKSMGLFEKMGKVLTSPSGFFDNIKSEKGVVPAFMYLAVIGIPAVVFTEILYIMFPLIALLSGGGGYLLLGLFYPVALYIAGLLLSFVGAGFIHLLAKLLNGKGNYSATFKALTYSSTPAALFGWIPLIGFIPSLYSIYLGMKGISKLHEVSMWRAFFILIGIVLIVAIVIGIIATAVVWLVRPLPSQ